ncbi:MAG: hypothetical protein M1365_03395 [Actinobacteria bacterium]|nr:hypothetical protein [Actinomycetota bacterium]
MAINIVYFGLIFLVSNTISKAVMIPQKAVPQAGLTGSKLPKIAKGNNI